MELYNRITGKLRGYSVSDSDTERVQSRINQELDSMNQKEQGYSLIDFIFSWIDRLWLRRGLVMISLFLLVMFVVQQAVMMDKIGLIEQRMSRTNIDNILEYQRVMQAVSLGGNSVTGIREDDSLKVSVRDMEALIEAYREMQNSYRRLEVHDKNNRISGKENGRGQI